MDVYRIVFAGPEKIREQIPLMERIAEVLRTKLRDKESAELYFGCGGDFDFLASLAAKTLQRECGCSLRLFLLQSDHAQSDGGYNAAKDALRSLGATVVAQNQWMADRADLLVAYVKANRSSAAAMLRFAKKQGSEVINLAE